MFASLGFISVCGGSEFRQNEEQRCADFIRCLAKFFLPPVEMLAPISPGRPRVRFSSWRQLGVLSAATNQGRRGLTAENSRKKSQTLILTKAEINGSFFLLAESMRRAQPGEERPWLFDNLPDHNPCAS
jgi:hypothetical protein